MQAMCDTASGTAGAPGNVLASSDGATASGVLAPKKKTTLRPPTSLQEEQKSQQRRQTKKRRPENINIEIPKVKKVEEKMKQPSLKEFLEFAKQKNDEKESEKIEEEEFSAKNPEDKSREASIMEVFYGICHVKEYIHPVVTANDDKWKR